MSIDPQNENHVIKINDHADAALGIEEVFYFFQYNWGILSNYLTGRIKIAHPRYDTQIQQYINLIDAVTTWNRPQHLQFGPSIYRTHHHPFSKNRYGIRWIGWVPFELNPSDVPEAEIVQQMNGGTLVATQSKFWQAHEKHPNYSREAINRAQEVETRLNLLGVLPTTIEIERGDWGKSGA